MNPRTAASIVTVAHIPEAFAALPEQGDRWRVYQLARLAGDGSITTVQQRAALRVAARLSRAGAWSRRQALAVAEATAALQVENEETAARHAMLAIEEVWPAGREHFLGLLDEDERERWARLLDVPLSISATTLATTKADIEASGAYRTLPDPRRAVR